MSKRIHLIRSDRDNDQIGGGFAILCRDELKPKQSMQHTYESFEHDVISVKSQQKKSLVVVVHRPPSLSIPRFLAEFADFLGDIISFDSSVVISCDFNMHWDKPADPYVQQLVAVLDTFDLKQHVEQATHIKGHILDYIITRSTDQLHCTAPIIGDLVSDHHIVMCQISLPVSAITKQQVSFRKIKNIVMETFRKDLNESRLLSTNSTRKIG